MRRVDPAVPAAAAAATALRVVPLRGPTGDRQHPGARRRARQPLGGRVDDLRPGVFGCLLDAPRLTAPAARGQRELRVVDPGDRRHGLRHRRNERVRLVDEGAHANRVPQREVDNPGAVTRHARAPRPEVAEPRLRSAPVERKAEERTAAAEKQQRRAVRTPEHVPRHAVGRELHRLRGSVGRDDIEIRHARALPREDNPLAVARPHGVRRMLDVDELLDTERRRRTRAGLSGARRDAGEGDRRQESQRNRRCHTHGETSVRDVHVTSSRAAINHAFT